MSRDAERFRPQSEYNKLVYERLQVAYPDLVDRKVTVLFYSALHRVNYWFDAQTGSVPKSRVERRHRVRDDISHVLDTYDDLCLTSRGARYCEGFRIRDGVRGHAARLLERPERGIPFAGRWALICRRPRA